MAFRVLVIEDNPWNMRLVGDILEAAGYVFLEAADGKSGIEKALTEKPDLILLDVMLPDMNGVQVTRQLREESATATLPIIALTANANDDLRVRCLEVGCTDYMTKPFTRRVLLEIIQRHLPA